ncbi:hypothetical protein [Pseudonocardia phyllosphaerae]
MDVVVAVLLVVFLAALAMRIGSAGPRRGGGRYLVTRPGPPGPDRRSPRL